MAEVGEQKEIVDSIRIEASDVSPQVDRAVSRIAHVCSDIIEADFGKYMMPAVRKNGREATSSIVLTGQGGNVHLLLNSDYDYYDPLLREEAERNNDGGIATVGSFGGIPLITLDPNWLRNEGKIGGYTTFTPEQKKKADSVPGVTTYSIDPKDIWDNWRYVRAIPHELGHQYQDPKLPSAWRELSAEFIAKRVIDKILFAHNIPAAEFVDNLIERYGQDSIFRLFFGTLHNPIAKHKILKELTPEKIRELFPSRRHADLIMGEKKERIGAW